PISKCQSLVVFFRTRSFVASSAAALVSERVIDPTTRLSQQPFLKKCHFSPMPCEQMLMA
ncbi:hypothetical protein, partial [Aliirhizobium cellulosilyticum]|uniref:hypothetical protein n=1 Tax=Aliirhizobium cellulosilyticum TaxID=393664 RepID=UPI001AEE015B